MRRNALSLETYKFFADYHGFAAFAGIAISHEWLYAHDHTTADETYRYRWNGIRPGLVFGWDIRPNRLQAFYLRTHLRWFPNLNVSTSAGRKLSFDQLEFNFIQLVVFPGRLF